MKKLPKLHLCCATDFRETLQHILITKENIIATDGHIMAINKTNEVFEEEFISNFPYDEFYIHYSVWKEIWNKRFYWENNNIIVVKSGLEIKVPIVHNPDWKYPNWKNVIPNTENLVDINEIGLKPELLYKLEQSLPIDGAYHNLKFTGKDRAILLFDNSNVHKSFGLIMPVVIKR